MLLEQLLLVLRHRKKIPQQLELELLMQVPHRQEKMPQLLEQVQLE